MIPKSLVDTWLAKKDVAAGFKLWLDEFCEGYGGVHEAEAPAGQCPGGGKRRSGAAADLTLSPLKKLKVLFSSMMCAFFPERAADVILCSGIPVLFPGSNCKCYVGGHRSLFQSSD